MRKLLLFLFVSMVAQAQTTISRTSASYISHSDALISIHATTQNWKFLRYRWSVGAQDCSAHQTGTGIHLVNTNFGGYTPNYPVDGDPNRTDFIATNFPANTVVNVCPELTDDSAGNGPWSSGAKVTFTTQSLPAVHPAVPRPARATVPTEPNMTGACVWQIGSANAITRCTGDTTATPQCDTLQNCWNQAMREQLAHPTVIQIQAGTTLNEHLWVQDYAADAQANFNGSSFVSSSKANMQLNLAQSWAEGQGIQFGGSYAATPGNGNSGDDTCDGIYPGIVYYVHYLPEVADHTQAVGLTCEAVYGSAGSALMKFQAGKSGHGNMRFALYPRALNWIMIRTSTPDAQFAAPNTRVDKSWLPKMATLRPAIIPPAPANTINYAGTSISNYFINFSYGPDTGGDMFANERLPAKTWFTGLELVPPSTGNDTVNGNPTYMQGSINFTRSTTDVVFDRDYIHGLPWPDRIDTLISWDGHNNAFINNYFENLDMPRAMSDACHGVSNNTSAGYPNPPDSRTQIKMSDGNGPFIFSNNFFESSGIGLFFDDGNMFATTENNGRSPRQDFLITRNLFFTPRSYMAAGKNGDENPLWDGHAHSERQPLEFKAGRRINIDGNIFDGAYRVNSVGSMTLTSVDRYGIKDVSITNNTLRHDYAGIVVVSTSKGGSFDSRSMVNPIDRVLIRNNIFTDINSAKYNGRIEGNVCDGSCNCNDQFGQAGYTLKGIADGEDYIIDHNTVTDTFGITPGVIYPLAQGVEGLQITNNILDVSTVPGGAASLDGMTRDGDAQNTVGGPDCNWGNTPGVPFFSCLYPHAVVSGNVLRAPYGGSASGWSVYSGNYVPSSFTADPGWLNASTQNMELSNASDFISGKKNGNQPGVDMNALSVAQGIVSGATANSITGTSATITFVAPDAQACSVDYSATDQTVISTFTRVADTNTTRNRSVLLTGLSPHTAYYYRVNCSVQQPKGVLRTQ